MKTGCICHQNQGLISSLGIFSKSVKDAMLFSVFTPTFFIERKIHQWLLKMQMIIIYVKDLHYSTNPKPLTKRINKDKIANKFTLYQKAESWKST